MKIPIDKCPYCNNTYDFYTKDYICGTSWYNYKFDGSEADNGEMYNGLKHTQGKYAYCGSCNRKLFKIEE